jgi:lysine 2,3-aminomutase
MSNKSIMERYTFERFKADAGRIIPLVEQASSVEEARRALFSHVSDEQFERCGVGINSNAALPHIVRDCARAWRSILLRRSEKAAGFSIVQALWDLTRGKPRPELEPGFYAELTHLSLGLEGNVAVPESEVSTASTSLSGREAALVRSRELDKLWALVETRMSRYEDGLERKAVRRRSKRRAPLTQPGGTSPTGAGR